MGQMMNMFLILFNGGCLSPVSDSGKGMDAGNRKGQEVEHCIGNVSMVIQSEEVEGSVDGFNNPIEKSSSDGGEAAVEICGDNVIMDIEGGLVPGNDSFQDHHILGSKDVQAHTAFDSSEVQDQVKKSCLEISMDTVHFDKSGPVADADNTVKNTLKRSGKKKIRFLGSNSCGYVEDLQMEELRRDLGFTSKVVEDVQ